jgi:hypothetical protein
MNTNDPLEKAFVRACRNRAASDCFSLAEFIRLGANKKALAKMKANRMAILRGK